MSDSIDSDIDKFFSDLNIDIKSSLDKNHQENIDVDSNLRYSLNKIYNNIKFLAYKYDIGYRIPSYVQEIIKLKNYSYKTIGKHDWIVFTDKGDFVYLENKSKWYFYTEFTYKTKEFGESIKQIEMINILLK